MPEPAIDLNLLGQYVLELRDGQKRSETTLLAMARELAAIKTEQHRLADNFGALVAVSGELRDELHLLNLRLQALEPS